MSKDYTFKLNYDEIQIPKSLKFLNRLSEEVCNHLLIQNKYYVKSNVQLKHLSSFLSFLNSDEVSPKVTPDNFCDYFLLGEELYKLTDYFTKPEFDKIHKISILTNIKETDNSHNKEELEDYISENLDSFLENHFNDMYSIPFQSLYNIFYNKRVERKLTRYDLAYQFITKSLDKSTEKNDNKCQQHLFILLGSIDSKFLTISELVDSIMKQEQHFGFLPMLNFSFISILNEIFTKLSIKIDCNIKEIIEELKQKLREIDQIIIENQQLKKTNEEDQENLSKMVQIVQKLQGEIDNLQKENQEKEKNINKMQEKIDNLQKENQEKDKNINKMQGKIDNLQKENQEKDKNINNMQENIDNLQKDNQEKQLKMVQIMEKMKKMYLSKNESLLNLQNENEGLHRDLNNLQEESREKDKNITKLQEEISNLQKRIQDKKEIDNLLDEKSDNEKINFLDINQDKEQGDNLLKEKSDNEEIDILLEEKSDDEESNKLLDESQDNKAKKINIKRSIRPRKKKRNKTMFPKRSNKMRIEQKRTEEEEDSLEKIPDLISFDNDLMNADNEQVQSDNNGMKKDSNSTNNSSTFPKIPEIKTKKMKMEQENSDGIQNKSNSFISFNDDDSKSADIKSSKSDNNLNMNFGSIDSFSPFSRFRNMGKFKTNKKKIEQENSDEIQNKSDSFISFNNENTKKEEFESTKAIFSNSTDNISVVSNSDIMDETLDEEQLFGSKFEIENIENIGFPLIKCDSITIISFLRSHLYTKDLVIKKFYVENKSDSQSNIGDLMKLIKKDYSTLNSNRVLKYYLYKNNPFNFKIKYLDDKDLIYQIPNFILIQLVPHRSLPFRICVFIDITKIDFGNFDPNRDGIPFAIAYHKNFDTNKTILDYLFHSLENYKEILESPQFQPVFYRFVFNSFSEVDDEKNVFQNLDEPCFFSLRSDQANRMVFDLFRSHIANKYIFRPK